MGEDVSNTSIIAKILGSLPTKFGALITAWDSVAPEIQTALQERLLKEENRISAQDQEASAFSATMSTGKGNRGHDKASSRKRGGQRAQRSSKDVTCYYCHGKGHYAYQCRKKNREEKGKTSSARSSHSTDIKNAAVTPEFKMSATKNLSRAQYKNFLAKPAGDIWLSDSCASWHITYR